jgi:hypothetical protein
MSDPISTLEMSVRWADQVGAGRDRANTSYFVFSHDRGHLVVRKPVVDVGNASVDASTQPGTTPPSLPLRVPRAMRVGSRPDDRYKLLKKYEGFVTAHSNDGFSARLSENPKDYPTIEAEFDLEELSEADRRLLVDGASLVWTIGYRYDGSTCKRESAIYLRRLPAWSDEEIAKATQATESLTSDIPWQ